ncbi:hypothetical protein K439DRAFT_1621520 [Ramaria rubella]|nr:hypothetical protein K439DRAFT_1621520 [Ramaria rubella]
MPASQRVSSQQSVKMRVAATSLAELTADKEASSKKFGKAQATTDKYEQCLKQGHKWLQSLLDNEAKMERSHRCPAASIQDWDKDDIEHAFDRIPTQASPWVLALFIVAKCFGETECGPSTAWEIYSAFKRMWHQADPNGKYQGRWLWDEERQGGHGNPAESTEVDEVITSVKNRQGAEGTHSHSCAMTKEYMDLIMGWSNQQCPPETLRLLSNLQSSDYHQSLPVATKHYFMRAFAASGWTIWTRNFELAKLQYKHVVEDAHTDDRYRFQHLLVTLENRKGWQHKLSQETDLHGHKYEIHPQREMPSVDMEFHFREWLTFLRAFVYCRDLQADDFIFPSVNPKGLIQPRTPISHDTIQKWIDEFVIGAGINLRLGRLTTHCFRRGGVQYRFMYAPVGKALELGHYLLVGWLGRRRAHRGFDQLPNKEMQAIFSAQIENITAKLFESCRSTNTTWFGITNSASLPSTLHRCGEHSALQVAEVPSIATELSRTTSESGMPRDLRIPPLPRTGSMNMRWKCAVRDWLEPDLSRGHNVALKDWNASWYTGVNRERFGVQYGKRKLIAFEFLQVCNDDEAEFVRKWPMADTGGPSKLLKAMHTDRLASGAAKQHTRKCDDLVFKSRSRRVRK